MLLVPKGKGEMHMKSHARRFVAALLCFLLLAYAPVTTHLQTVNSVLAHAGCDCWDEWQAVWRASTRVGRAKALCDQLQTALDAAAEAVQQADEALAIAQKAAADYKRDVHDPAKLMLDNAQSDYDDAVDAVLRAFLIAALAAASGNGPALLIALANIIRAELKEQEAKDALVRAKAVFAPIKAQYKILLGVVSQKQKDLEQKIADWVEIFFDLQDAIDDLEDAVEAYNKASDDYDACAANCP